MNKKHNLYVATMSSQPKRRRRRTDRFLGIVSGGLGNASNNLTAYNGWMTGVLAIWLLALFVNSSHYASILAGFHLASVSVSVAACLAGEVIYPILTQCIVLLPVSIIEDPIVLSSAFFLLATLPGVIR